MNLSIEINRTPDKDEDKKDLTKSIKTDTASRLEEKKGSPITPEDAKAIDKANEKLMHKDVTLNKSIEKESPEITIDRDELEYKRTAALNSFARIAESRIPSYELQEIFQRATIDKDGNTKDYNPNSPLENQFSSLTFNEQKKAVDLMKPQLNTVVTDTERSYVGALSQLINFNSEERNQSTTDFMRAYENMMILKDNELNRTAELYEERMSVLRPEEQDREKQILLGNNEGFNVILSLQSEAIQIRAAQINAKELDAEKNKLGRDLSDAEKDNIKNNALEQSKNEFQNDRLQFATRVAEYKSQMLIEERGKEPRKPTELEEREIFNKEKESLLKLEVNISKEKELELEKSREALSVEERTKVDTLKCFNETKNIYLKSQNLETFSQYLGEDLGLSKEAVKYLYDSYDARQETKSIKSIDNDVYMEIRNEVNNNRGIEDGPSSVRIIVDMVDRKMSNKDDDKYQAIFSGYEDERKSVEKTSKIQAMKEDVRAYFDTREENKKEAKAAFDASKISSNRESIKIVSERQYELQNEALNKACESLSKQDSLTAETFKELEIAKVIKSSQNYASTSPDTFNERISDLGKELKQRSAEKLEGKEYDQKERIASLSETFNEMRSEGKDSDKLEKELYKIVYSTGMQKEVDSLYNSLSTSQSLDQAFSFEISKQPDLSTELNIAKNKDDLAAYKSLYDDAKEKFETEGRDTSALEKEFEKKIKVYVDGLSRNQELRHQSESRPIMTQKEEKLVDLKNQLSDYKELRDSLSSSFKSAFELDLDKKIDILEKKVEFQGKMLEESKANGTYYVEYANALFSKDDRKYNINEKFTAKKEAFSISINKLDKELDKGSDVYKSVLNNLRNEYKKIEKQELKPSTISEKLDIASSIARSYEKVGELRHQDEFRNASLLKKNEMIKYVRYQSTQQAFDEYKKGLDSDRQTERTPDHHTLVLDKYFSDRLKNEKEAYERAVNFNKNLDNPKEYLSKSLDMAKDIYGRTLEKVKDKFDKSLEKTKETLKEFYDKIKEKTQDLKNYDFVNKGKEFFKDKINSLFEEKNKIDSFDGKTIEKEKDDRFSRALDKFKDQYRDFKNNINYIRSKKNIHIGNYKYIWNEKLAPKFKEIKDKENLTLNKFMESYSTQLKDFKKETESSKEQILERKAHLEKEIQQLKDKNIEDKELEKRQKNITTINSELKDIESKLKAVSTYENLYSCISVVNQILNTNRDIKQSGKNFYELSKDFYKSTAEKVKLSKEKENVYSKLKLNDSMRLSNLSKYDEKTIASALQGRYSSEDRDNIIKYFVQNPNFDRKFFIKTASKVKELAIS